MIAACSAPAVVVSPSPTALLATTSTPVPAPSPTPPHTGDAEFFFQPGAMQWCGVFGSYRPPSTTLSGELKIGATTLAASSGGPAPYDQRVASGVRAGDWVCLSGTTANSETTANLLTTFTLDVAPIASMPSGPIRATPCGTVTDFFVTDIPSGGFVTLAGTKFLVGGARLSPDVVQLPPGGDLKLGVRVCITGTTLRAQDPGTFTAISGRVTVIR